MTRSHLLSLSFLTAAVALSTLPLTASAGDLVDARFGVPTVAVPSWEPFYGPGYGWSDVIRARGESTLLISESRINNEVARGMAIDNNVKFVAARLERRAMGKAARDEFYARKRAGRTAYLAKRRAEAASRQAGVEPVDEAPPSPLPPGSDLARLLKLQP